MKNYYSLIQISPNPLIDDQITVGLLMITPGKIFIKFSNRKKSVTGTLLKDSKIVDFLTNQIYLRVKELNKLNNTDDNLFTSSSFLSDNFFNHLSKSHHGILRFSEPSAINVIGSNENFVQLFSKLVDSHDTTHKSTSNQLNQKIERTLISHIKDRMHTHYKFKKNQFLDLYFNFDIDAIGKNGSIYALKTLDFSSLTIDTIEKNIFHYNLIKEQLSKYYAAKNNKFILIADEPESINSEEHSVWEYQKRRNMFDFKHSDEASAIVEEIERSGIQKFLN